MLLNGLFKDFNKKVKVMTWVGIVAILLGTAAFVLSYSNSSHETFQEGFYEGTGAGLVAAGAVCVIYYRIVLNNAEKRKKAEINEKDERNRFIILKAAYMAFFIMIFVLYIGVLLAGPVNHLVFMALLIALVIHMGLFGALYFILRFFH